MYIYIYIYIPITYIYMYIYICIYIYVYIYEPGPAILTPQWIPMVWSIPQLLKPHICTHLGRTAFRVSVICSI